MIVGSHATWWNKFIIHIDYQFSLVIIILTCKWIYIYIYRLYICDICEIITHRDGIFRSLEIPLFLCASTARYLYAQRSLRWRLELICQVHGEGCGAWKDHPHLGCWISMGYGIDSWAMNGIYSSIFLNEILALVTNRDIIMEIYRDII